MKGFSIRFTVLVLSFLALAIYLVFPEGDSATGGLLKKGFLGSSESQVSQSAQAPRPRKLRVRKRDENTDEMRAKVRAHLLEELSAFKGSYPEIDFRRLSPGSRRALENWKMTVKNKKKFSLQGLGFAYPTMKELEIFKAEFTKDFLEGVR